MARRVIFTAVCVLIFQAPMFSQDWRGVVDRLEKSTVAIEHGGAVVCTGVTIHEAKDLVLTAAHCAPENEQVVIYADRMPATIVSKDAKRDLMVLVVPGLDRPALPLARANPQMGDAVASFGYGYAWDRPMFRVAHISDDRTYVNEGGIGGPFFVIDAAFVGGQSGGPVVNLAGELVMIVQRASDRVGLGVGAELIKDRVGRFFEKQP